MSDETRPIEDARRTQESRPLALTIATRGSALALWQANHVRDRLRAVEPVLVVEMCIIKTTGDMIQDRPLAEVGGKGLFVKEIEQALLDCTADIAVHSMKDVPAELAPGLVMAAVSKREDPRDALVSRDGSTLDALPAGARVGTSSLRRACQLLARRPDLDVVPLRGNVPTRLRKVDQGEVDAVVLAAAGLVRLGHHGRISQILEPAICLPAAGQGALGIETRRDDRAAISLVREAIHDEVDGRCVTAERAFLGHLGGTCQTPLAAHARMEARELVLDGLIAQPDGKVVVRGSRRGQPGAAERLGIDLARELLDRGGDRIVAALVAPPAAP